MTCKTFLATTLCAAACLTAVPASAQFQKPEDAIKYRKAAFTLMAAHFGRVGAMAQGKAPWDAQAAAANMAVVMAVHQLPFTAFGAGTDSGDTRALPEVWSKPADFKAAGHGQPRVSPTGRAAPARRPSGRCRRAASAGAGARAA